MSTHDKYSHLPLYAKGPLKCALKGQALLDSPLFNKGSAFTKEEREKFGLNGMLPAAVHTLDQQVERAYQQYSERSTALGKNTFLNSLKDQNLTLFFALLWQHVGEMYPIIYTPTEGEAIEQYSRLFRRPDGCFLNIDEHTSRSSIASILKQFGGEGDIDYIVLTDGEEILGIGDQGVGGIGISVAKLVLMTLCAGVWPNRTLPIVLDCGTDNKSLLNDAAYLGLRHPRVRSSRYNSFIDDVVQSIKSTFPTAILHFEDFGLGNARRLLEIYSEQLPCFNDDIQGTGAVTMAAIHAACQVSNVELKDARVLIFGAGTAGTGVADQFVDALLTEGLEVGEARGGVWLVDKSGLLTTFSEEPTEAQKPYLRKSVEWEGKDTTALEKLISEIKPHILIGCSTSPGAFTEKAVREMAKHTPHPIILPLSNPTRLIEAKPEDILKWTDFKALVATGGPFDPIPIPNSSDDDGNLNENDERKYVVAECNNATIFPAIGLSLILTRSKLLTPPLLATAVKALSLEAPCVKQNDKKAALLPDITDVRDISVKVAVKVIRKIVGEGLARVDDIPEDEEELEGWVRGQMWDVSTYRDLEAVDAERVKEALEEGGEAAGSGGCLGIAG
ncbi:Aminoacid dehydrogenase-like protein [Ascobolus immersus RN42]|uniref:Aminoacid dehydrogenase-like protein n=1 Tax=Ascobolus immersus RN42 TaxID=1160509 RepID=A0A3N4HN84_ASCIM|nr:Aminoacid dehydrogenase-like protein [Ascobolus immersus RN42]